MPYLVQFVAFQAKARTDEPLTAGVVVMSFDDALEYAEHEFPAAIRALGAGGYRFIDQNGHHAHTGPGTNSMPKLA